MTIEYGEFESLLAPYSEKDIKVAVGVGMAKYLTNYTAKNEDPEAVARSIFEERITPLTNQKKGAGRGGAEPYLGMIESWKKGDGSFPLAKAAYYWLHLEPSDATYASIVDMKLLKKPFHVRFQRTVSGEPVQNDRQVNLFHTYADLDALGPSNRHRAFSQIALNTSIVFPHSPGSGLEFSELIQLAKHELFFCGQNLFSLIGIDNGDEARQLLLEATARGVSTKLMICDPNEKDHIGPWSFACSSLTYEADLRKAVEIFTGWLTEFPKGALQARVAKFIPTSITFVDPTHVDFRFALITPHHFTSVTAARPSILLTHLTESAFYDSYYRNYRHVWQHAREL